MNCVKQMAFRKEFQLKSKLVKWFPKHMGRGYRQIESTLRKVDLILEVHDSRIPLSGRNTNLIGKLSAIKPHVLIMNKTDLLDNRYKNKIKHRLEDNNENIRCIFIDALNPVLKMSGFSEILPTVLDLIRSSNRFNREDSNEYQLMIIGIPNVGKSTIINKLRNNYLKVGGRATTTGPNPGVTKSVLERIKINASPAIYLFDTPGVLDPKLDRTLEMTMRCALCATIANEKIGIINIADYLLYWLNSHNSYSYVDLLNLDKPSDDIMEVLVKGSVSLKYLIESKDRETGQIIKRPDLEVTAKAFVTAFRSGKLGRFLLDDDLI